MKINDQTLVAVLLGLALLFPGCSTTIHEKKATDTDPGTMTQLKLGAQNVKIVHDF